jgi:hypothetical protein
VVAGGAATTFRGCQAAIANSIKTLVILKFGMFLTIPAQSLTEHYASGVPQPRDGQA